MILHITSSLVQHSDKSEEFADVAVYTKTDNDVIVRSEKRRIGISPIAIRNRQTVGGTLRVQNSAHGVCGLHWGLDGIKLADDASHGGGESHHYPFVAKATGFGDRAATTVPSDNLPPGRMIGFDAGNTSRVEIKGIGPFIGFIELVIPRFEAHFTPCVEIGWRLAAEHWGKGYAPEGARAAAAFGFQTREELVSFTVPENHASRRVMEKIGMTHDPSEDFVHPSLPECHPLRRHVLYRLLRDDSD